MLQVDHGSTRRASTSSTQSHADSFHSLPPLSHESHPHEDALTSPHSGADATDAYASACQSYAYSIPNDTYAHSSSISPSINRPDDEELTAVHMERKDSKFTVASSSSSTRRYSTSRRAAKSPATSRRPSISRHKSSFSQSGMLRPQLGSRRNTFTQEDAYAVHARACALFPNGRRTSQPSSQIYSVPTSQVSLDRRTSLTALASRRASSEQSQAINVPVHSRAPSYAGTLASTMNAVPFDQDVPHAASPPPRQTVIDWTDPATRKTTYDQYDQDRRGVRGLWRKLTPDFFWRGSRVEFYGGKNDDDTCSVRRYRLDLDDLKDEGCSENQEKAAAPRPGYKRSWSCFGSSRRS